MENKPSYILAYRVKVTLVREYRLQKFCCAFLSGRSFSGNFVVKRTLEDIELRCRICQASCTFVITKLRFVLKGDLPTAAASERFYRCFALRKKVRTPPLPKYHSKMKRRTKVYQLRLTPEEQSTLKEKAKGKPVADYIRAALTEFSDTDARQRLELINNLGEFYRKFRDELSWAGSNLNQSVKRANELAVAGLLPPIYIREVLMPVILETQKTLNEIKRNLETVTRKAVKL